MACQVEWVIVTILVLQLKVLPTVTQNCLQSADDSRNIPFQDLGESRLASGGSRGVQAIVTSYHFHCCGNITAWQTFVSTCSPKGAYEIIFQVWRPSPTVNSDGCYGLVGENTFTNITLSGCLVSVTPEPTNIITVQPGDVVGFYAVVGNARSSDGIQLDTSFTGESVWYHRNTDNDPLTTRGEISVCPFPAGSQSDKVLKSFTNAAPMLSVDLRAFPCPSRTSPPTLSVTLTTTPTSKSSYASTQTSSGGLNSSSVGLNPSSGGLNSSGGLSREIIGSIGAVGGLVILVTSIVLFCIPILLIRRRATRAQATLTNEGSDMLAIEMQGNASYTTISHIPITTNESYMLVSLS